MFKTCEFANISHIASADNTHAIETGITKTETVASAIVIARELDTVAHARQTILRYVPAQILDRIEAALDAVRHEPAARS